MEEIIQILIFVGAMVIAVVGQSAKNKKKETTASPQEVLEDVFPDIDYQEKTEEASLVQPMCPIIKRTSIQTKKTKTVPESQRTTPTVPKQERKIRMNTRNEARRAFIHSEIFNRKY